GRARRRRGDRRAGPAGRAVGAGDQRPRHVRLHLRQQRGPGQGDRPAALGAAPPRAGRHRGVHRRHPARRAARRRGDGRRRRAGPRPPRRDLRLVLHAGLPPPLPGPRAGGDRRRHPRPDRPPDDRPQPAAQRARHRRGAVPARPAHCGPPAFRPGGADLPRDRAAASVRDDLPGHLRRPGRPRPRPPRAALAHPGRRHPGAAHGSLVGCAGDAQCAGDAGPPRTARPAGAGWGGRGTRHVGQHRQDPPAPRVPQARRREPGRGGHAQPRPGLGAPVTVSARGSYRSRLPRVPSIFCTTPAAQEVVRDLPPLTVLRAPRGFGKTSTVAFWLRSGALDDRAAAWINLNRPTDAEELWAALHDTLVAAELAAPEAAPGPESVTDALRHLTQRLALVVGGLHHVRDTTVDRPLVEIIQAHELVHVVATSRVERPITSIGTTTVDTRVLDVAELVLTVDEALLLAEQLGLNAARDDVARLVAEYAGWPALVRAALLGTRRGPDGRLVTDRAAASRYAALVLSDPELAPWHDIVTGLAVPDLLRREDLPALFEDPEDRAAAEVVLEHSFTLVRSDEGFRYPAGLRHALLEHLAAERPERYRELNERLGRLRRAQHDPVAALEYARRAQAWPLALLVLEEHWAQLLRRHTDHVRAAVLTMPRDLVRSSPRLVVARDHILDRDVPHQAEAALRGGLLLPGRTLPAHALTTTQRL